MRANAFSFLELVKEGVGNSKKCRKLDPDGKADQQEQQSGAPGVDSRVPGMVE